MIRHNIKLSFRNLVKQWLLSAINILGLGFGIACCILIYLFVQYERGFDKFHEDSDRIFRVISRYVKNTGEVGYTSFQPYSIVEGFLEDIPSVERISAFRYTQAWIEYEKKNIRERVAFVDPDFLEMFSFQMIAGNKKNALDNPQSIVITRGVADKFFSDSTLSYDNIIGQSLTLPQRPPNEFTITGIIEDVPENSSLKFNLLAPFDNCIYYPRSNDSFGSNSVYVQLSQKDAMEQAENTANTLIEKYRGEKIEELTHFGFLKDSEDNFTFQLQSLKDIYLHSDDTLWGYEIKGSEQNIYILSIIAIIILLIASINYIMLAIGHSMDRMKEMGIMKILGAHKIQIIRQFRSESFLLVLLALFIGIVFAEQILPVFNKLAQRDLSFTIYKNYGSYLFLLTILFFIVFTTSSYIALFLLKQSSPLSILKNEFSIGKRYRFARTFVIVQYFISIALIISTGIIIKQLNFMLNKSVGFDEENIVVLPVDFSENKVYLLKEKLNQYPLIKNVTTSDRNFSRSRSSVDIKNHKDKLIGTRILRIDPDYINTLGLQLEDGRNFSESDFNDTVSSIIVNETFVNAFELKSPVGKRIFIESFNIKVDIIGVVRDFHYDSMKEEIQPLMMVLRFNTIWHIFIRIDNQDVPGALAQIKQTWNEVVPEYLFEYSFLDDNLDKQYDDQQRWGRITRYSAIAAIFLSCLGLLGLTGLLVSRRIKEIGIRKVNGAKVINILVLINSDFQIWVFVAFILACPVTYIIMNKWLQDFYYRININWWIFIWGGIFAILCALIIVTWRSWRFAIRNPVDTLRYE